MGLVRLLYYPRLLDDISFLSGSLSAHKSFQFNFGGLKPMREVYLNKMCGPPHSLTPVNSMCLRILVSLFMKNQISK